MYRPRYLTLSVGINLEPLSLIEKVYVILFCFDLNMMSFDLSALRESLFAWSQSVRVLKSLLRTVSKVLIFVAENEIHVSSAK